MIDQILQGVTSKNDELMLLLKHRLPHPCCRFWHTAKDLHRILQSGGLHYISEKFVVISWRGNREIHNNFEKS